MVYNIVEMSGPTESITDTDSSVRQLAGKPSIWDCKTVGWRFSQRWWRWLVVCAAVLAAGLASSRARIFHTRADAESTQKEQIVVQKPAPMCSKPWTGDPADDCTQTQCCEVSGQSCYEKWYGLNGCLEGCDPAQGWTCHMPHNIVPLAEVSRKASEASILYCFSVYTNNTGSSKKSYELELIQQQYQRKASIFTCDYHNVYSDVIAQVGPGYPTTKVDDVEHNFHVLKREAGSWVNTGMFMQVWKAMSGSIGLKKAEWIVKVDADAVFVPHRLKAALKGHRLTNNGIYFETCEGVTWGLFGNLEVLSQQAFYSLLANIDSCSEKIDWVKGTKWGPIGEDLFAQMCMDYQGVSRVQNFDLTTDALCPGTKKRWGEKDNKLWKPPCGWLSTPAMHPFKKPEDYFSCLDATLRLG